jgi:hypothetical protein
MNATEKFREFLMWNLRDNAIEHYLMLQNDAHAPGN